MEYVIGVDLGGTKIATGLCDKNGVIVSRVINRTDSCLGKNSVLQKISASIIQVMELSQINIAQVAGIGISSPGPLSVSEGIINYVATLGWENVPIRDLIHKEFRVPVYLENDCNAAAYGEFCLGSGRGTNNMIYITVSTGIGSGIIINGGIYRGKHDAAGEFGHICVEYGGRKCECGNLGCLQAYSSGSAIAEIAVEEIKRGSPSNMLQMVKGLLQNIDAVLVEIAALEGDETALRIWDGMAVKLGQGISILVQLFDPDLIIIGGGASKAWNLFYNKMLQTVKENTYKIFSKDIKIVPASLGGDSGILGAAMLVIAEQSRGLESLHLNIS